MHWSDHLDIGIKGLLLRKLRSLLSTLGIIFGGCNRAIPRIRATQSLVFCKDKSIDYEALIEMALDWE